jgi:hypothetical protein
MKRFIAFAAATVLCAFILNAADHYGAHAQFTQQSPVPQAQAAPAQVVGAPIGSPTYVLPPSGGVIDIGQAFGAFAPYINSAVNALILAAIGWACTRFQQSTGVTIDQAHRDSLAHALQNQAGSLIADGLVKMEGKTVTVPSAELATAAKEIIQCIPDAAAHFGLTPDYVAKRIVDMIPQTTAGAQIVSNAPANKPTAPSLV